MVHAGNNQSATVGTAVSLKPAVKVIDRHGNAVAGVIVTFAVAAGNGSLAGATQTTDSAGIATVGNWILATTAGAQTLTAMAAGATVSLEFIASALADVPISFQKIAGDSQTTGVLATSAVAMTIRAVDQYGNLVPGVVLSWIVSDGGIVSYDSSTNAEGEALSLWRMGEELGLNTANVRAHQFPELTAAFTARTVSWSEIATGEGPTPRKEPRMVHDEHRGVIVMLGGDDNSGESWRDHWEFDGFTWNRRQLAFVPEKYLPGLTYDVDRQRIVLFGGSDLGTGGPSDETWEFDGNVWAIVDVAVRPGTRDSPLLAYDSKRRKTVLYGGIGLGCDPEGEVNTICTDTWEFDGAEWRQVQTAVMPKLHYNSAIVYDEVNQVVTLMGYRLGAHFSESFFETWQYDGSAWKRVDTGPNTPRLHSLFGAVYDLERGRVVLFGGFGSDESGASADFATTWEFDGARWHIVATTTQPSRRSAFGIAFDRTKGRAILFGGWRTAIGALSTLRNDTWQYRTR